MSARTAAVFGASGKLGRRVLAMLEQRGYATRALIHRTPAPGRHVESIAGSIADSDAVDRVVSGAEVVIQLATAKEDSATFFDVSVRGTFNVLEACRRHKVRQFILVSGDAAFGIWFYPQPIPIDENHRLMAYPGYYAFSKVMEEVMAEQYSIQYGVPITVLRSSWVFDGAELLNHFSLLHNVRPAEKGHGFGEPGPDVLELVRTQQERIPVLTDGAGVPLRRHIVHIDDVMQGFERAIGNPSALNQTFNIAGPAPFDYRVAADYLSAKLGVPTVELRCPDYHPFEINITRARSVLGYAPENDFFRMADRAIAARSL
ncbi:MAG: dTDP-glucose 4,6-dehydratase [Verrucomicrobiota bacterium]|jgi:nucleoside-diphosphate-sugar epimerase